MLWPRGSVQYSAIIEAKENLSAVSFVTTNPPEERAQVLLPEKELSKLSDKRQSIFEKSNTECYI